MSGDDNDNVESFGDARFNKFLHSEEGMEALGSAFEARVAKQNERPLTFDEIDNKRGYCQWKARILNEKIERGFLTQKSEIEYMREQLAQEIREVRNDWSPAQWREFVDQGGDLPATTYASSRKEVQEYIEQMREDFQAERSRKADPEEERDLLAAKRDLENSIHDVENISLKHWNERDQIQELVSEVFNSPIAKRVQGMFESGNESARFIAMTNIRNLYLNQKNDEADGITDWAVENGHLTEFEAGQLSKGQIPVLQRQDDPAPEA